MRMQAGILANPSSQRTLSSSTSISDLSSLSFDDSSSSHSGSSTEEPVLLRGKSFSFSNESFIQDKEANNSSSQITIGSIRRSPSQSDIANIPRSNSYNNNLVDATANVEDEEEGVGLFPAADTTYILKCYYEKEKKMNILLLEEGITFPDLLSWVQQKFGFSSYRGISLQSARGGGKQKESGDEDSLSMNGKEVLPLEDEDSLIRFFESGGVPANSSCVVYQLWIV